MTGIDPAAARAALAPVRAALCDAAAADAGQRLAVAESAAARMLADAQARAAATLAAARVAGTADGAAELAARRAGDERAARAAELRAASDAYRELRDRVTERVAHWCARPATRSLLAARARAALGADAVVSDARDGGVVATVAGRRLDLSARTIAATAVDALGADVAKLWSP